MSDSNNEPMTPDHATQFEHGTTAGKTAFVTETDRWLGFAMRTGLDRSSHPQATTQRLTRKRAIRQRLNMS